ncbi:helix-hairpin-helix domain-containing protein [Kitasatospora sp. NPDC085464]|uniref:helix-hairpin-helix domain-containing protein n=1 Tax=Kitasatospora sp. NPDC085464 TaxID=3364063 RepID=UPI0037C6DDF6
MTTMGLGAAKRQAINETVRLRMAALLPTLDEPPREPPHELPYEPPDGPADGPMGVRGVGAGGGGGGSPGRAPGSASSATDERRATGPPTGGAPSPPGADGGTTAAAFADPPGAPRDPPGVGVRLRSASFGSAVALDRRAVAGLVILLLFAVGYAVQHFWLARPETVAVPALAAASALPGTDGQAPVDAASGAGAAGAGAAVPGEAAPGAAVSDGAVSRGAAGAAVVIDVGGRVHVPGLHTLPGGSRVADALRAAGGVLPETDTRNLNLARVLTDGEQLLVGEQAGQAPAPAVGSGPGSGTGPPGPAVPRPPVSLNRATLEQLDTLPGVGPTLAQRILAYRASHGSFRSLDQLRQVSGIGVRTYAELRPLLTL